MALAAAALALLPAAAAAQLPMPSVKLGRDKPPPTTEEIAKQRALDKAYKAATEKIPEKNAAADPWSGIRPAAEPPTKPKPKPKQ